MPVVRLLALASVVASIGATATPAQAWWYGGYYPPAYVAPYPPRVIYVPPPVYQAPPVYPAPAYPYARPVYAAPALRPHTIIRRPVRTRPAVVKPDRIVPAVSGIAQPGRSPFESAGVGPVAVSAPIAIPPAPAPAPNLPPIPPAPEKNVYPPERDFIPFNGD